MNTVAMEAGFALGLLVLLASAFAIGRNLGRRHPDEHPQLGVVQGATLGVMGLLLGFSFSGAMTRFTTREDLIVRQANALSTLHLRTQLSDSHGDSMRATLNEYAGLMVKALDASSQQELNTAHERLAKLEHMLWQDARSWAQQQPTSAMLIVPAVNEMLDVRAARIAASKRHLPTLIMLTLLTCAALSVGTIGYGMAGGRKSLVPPALALVALMAAVLWVVLDLDYPRYGLIRIDDGPLRAAAAAIMQGS